jgi:hypothetical protein
MIADFLHVAYPFLLISQTYHLLLLRAKRVGSVESSVRSAKPRYTVYWNAARGQNLRLAKSVRRIFAALSFRTR